jgi:hypothetical protein
VDGEQEPWKKKLPTADKVRSYATADLAVFSSY